LSTGQLTTIYQFITTYYSKENDRKFLPPTIPQRVFTFYTAFKVPIHSEQEIEVYGVDTVADFIY
jgi:hypothetical protein